MLLTGVAAFAIYGYLFFARSGFSGSEITVSIAGPESFKAQEKVEFEIKISNQSKFAIQNAELFVTLPDFLAFKDKEGREQRIALATVGAREEVSQRIILFAEKTEKQGTIRARIDYTPQNLQGRFEKDASFDISVASLPLTVIFDLPKKVVSGQILRGSFHFVAEHELESLPLFAKVVPPEGFRIEDAAPSPQEGTTWKFERVEPQETYAADFEGVIVGEESATKTFELLFGNTNEDGLFAAQYSVLRKVDISASPLEFTQSVNGWPHSAGSLPGPEGPSGPRTAGQASSPQDDAKSYVAAPGEKLRFRIGYKNASGVNIEDVRITAQLNGGVFNFASLDMGQGYFSRDTRTVTWNKDFLSSLASLEKEGSGTVEFSISLKEEIVPESYRDKHVSVRSKAVIDSAKTPLALQGLSLRAEENLVVKIRTALALSQKAYYYEGPFSNSGPIPPKGGEKTTYTIVWQATNTLNDLTDTRIEAPLARHVVFEEKSYPANNKLTYNSETHSLAWNIGSLSAGAGTILPVETVSFQVSLTPQDVMRGRVVELVEQAQISGTDTFTGEFVESFAPALDTSLRDDVGIRAGDGVVQ